MEPTIWGWVRTRADIVEGQSIEPIGEGSTNSFCNNCMYLLEFECKCISINEMQQQFRFISALHKQELKMTPIQDQGS